MGLIISKPCLQARNIRTLRGAQDRYESPDDCDTDGLTPEMAAEVAADELLSTPAVVTVMLDRLCDPADLSGRDPVNVRGLEILAGDDFDPMDLNSGELLAVAMTGTHQHALQCLLALRERVQAMLHADIQTRARELLAEAA